jgi:hypothetical protein
MNEEGFGKEAIQLNGVFVLRSMEAAIEEGLVLPQVRPLLSQANSRNWKKLTLYTA